MHMGSRSSRVTRWSSLALAGGLVASCTNPSAPPAAPEPPVAGAQKAVVAGAGFTTFDATEGGCNDSPNGINCNNYTAKDKVYMSGGPSAGGLSAGTYFFAVVTPGHQNDGFLDGAVGNLSDDVAPAGATAGDVGGGDTVANRTFTVTVGPPPARVRTISYSGTHTIGTSPDGRLIVRLANYDDTDNAGGVYILAICAAGATNPSGCKYDAFRIPAGDGGNPYATVSGAKYYDANTNGQRDPGEVGIANWDVFYTDHVSDIIPTDENGNFSVQMTEDTYCFVESLAGSPWMQTGNVTDQTAVSGGASATLRADKSYSISVIGGSTIAGLNFGNICVGAGGGLTLGFWSNKNGQALIGADDLAALTALHLRKADGSDFDPATAAQVRTWLLNATATNMAYMLSAQLAAMKLNVFNGNVNGGSLIYAPGTTSANVNGFATVDAVIAEADAELAAHGLTLSGSPYRAYQEALKSALDNANNNRSFVQPGPASCPIPVLTAQPCTP